jgi:hypothetical protein
MKTFPHPNSHIHPIIFASINGNSLSHFCPSLKFSIDLANSPFYDFFVGPRPNAQPIERNGLEGNGCMPIIKYIFGAEDKITLLSIFIFLTCAITDE